MRSLDSAVRAVAEPMGIDARQAERRRALVELGEQDCALLGELHDRLGERRLELVDDLYRHLLVFDIVFCDLMMPQMTGMDLHRELSERVPEQATRMVFVTGGGAGPPPR